jgi:hypothetical protein
MAETPETRCRMRISGTTVEQIPAIRRYAESVATVAVAEMVAKSKALEPTGPVPRELVACNGILKLRFVTHGG